MFFYIGKPSLYDLFYRGGNPSFMLVFECTEDTEEGGELYSQTEPEEGGERFEALRELEGLFGVTFRSILSWGLSQWRPLFFDDGGCVFYVEAPTGVAGVSMGVLFQKSSRSPYSEYGPFFSCCRIWVMSRPDVITRVFLHGEP